MAGCASAETFALKAVIRSTAVELAGSTRSCPSPSPIRVNPLVFQTDKSVPRHQPESSRQPVPLE
jgi:hypothetical protein